VELYERGYRTLVSVIPPDAPLSPNSGIKPRQRGKVPGRKLANGTWAGYAWLTTTIDAAMVRQWANDGANIGILAEWFPGVDIDVTDEWLAKEIAAIALRVLGPAPTRIGRPPKRLLMYRTGEAFVRTALLIYVEGQARPYLVEVLGKGRQYLIHGVHPDTGKPYTWDRELSTFNPDKDLTWIKPADVERFMAEVTTLVELLPGVRVERVGGKTHDRTEQSDLLAPTLDALRTCVAAIPNANTMFPERNDYVKFGYAIRAAAGEADEDGFEIFLDWCARWDGGTNDPENARDDWRRMKPPYSVGWTWLVGLATTFGFNAGQHEFTADLPPDTETPAEEKLPLWSDAWLVERVIEEFGNALRFVPLLNKWFAYGFGRWLPDAVLRADARIECTLRRLAAAVCTRGASEKEQQGNARIAVVLCGASKHRDVRHLLRFDSRITAPPEAFDSDPWLLNTPGGTIDLRTATMRTADPADMCSRQTLVAPDFEMKSPLWNAFLLEATRGDIALQEYLRRLAGYALTGRTDEQMFGFLWGTGGNGKGTFLNALFNILASYAEAAPMELFTASSYERHPTDLAGLVGARLVTAVETQAGRRWDEQKIKTLTGQDPVRARYMRQDFFTYRPQFTLLIASNHKPEITDLDHAMRRRVHLVPFVVIPRVDNKQLGEQLRSEYPAILAWAIRGCLQWQEAGLDPPECVLAATAEYFAEEDALSAWLQDCCDRTDSEAQTPTGALYASWIEWSNERGERAGTRKRLKQELLRHHIDSNEKGNAYRGIQLLPLSLNHVLPGD
jgi:putative DNA primase/helicase